ncbi:MAG: T9SS type A sorting domain-containing protein [Candidatus Krumholzibacteria bacterium]|jgi:hypothetical protein|nr:T9SS type A sorting domain-containing protein [Candidatus Krumholzibacteria bacterium]
MTVIESRRCVAAWLLFVATDLLVIANPMFAGCIDYAEHIHWTAEYDPLHVSDVAISGNLAYVVGDFGFSVLDVSDSYAPIELGRIEGGYVNWARQVEVAGDIAYMTGNPPALRVVDIFDPAAPEIIAAASTDSGSRGLTLYDGYAYVGCNDRVLYRFDLTDPLQPVVVDQIALPGLPNEIVIRDGLAFIACGAAGLQIVDIDPFSVVRIVGSLDTAGSAFGIDVSGTLAIVADESNTFVFVDVSNPTNPSYIGEFTEYHWCMDVAIEGDVAFLADGPGCSVLDISDPLVPSVVGHITTYHTSVAITLAGGHMYLANGYGGLQIFDIDPPEGSEPLAVVGTVSGRFIGTYPPYAYLMSESRIEVLDVSLPEDPQLVSNRPMTLPALDGVVAGGFIYRTVGPDGTQVYSLDDPLMPAVIGSIDVYSQTIGVAPAAGVALIADNDAGMHIFNVQNPRDPQLLASATIGGVAEGVTIAGEFAYLAMGEDGFEIYDISEPVAPVFVTAVQGPGAARRIFVRGGIAYIANNYGLWTVAVSDPTTPAVLGCVQLPQFCSCVFVSDFAAYCSSWYSGLSVIDIADAAAPRRIGSIFAYRYPADVYVIDEYVYVHTQDSQYVNSELNVFSAQCNATTAVFLPAFSATPAPGFVTVSWRAFAGADSEYLLQAITDRAEWTVPYEVLQDGSEFLATDRDARLRHVDTVRYRLLVREGGEAWLEVASQTVDLSPYNTATRILNAYPNPFNPSTSISFECDEVGPTTLTVHDLAGRRVVRLIDETLPAGRHEVVWLGRDDGGRAVATGSYVLRLSSNDRVDSWKIVLVR